jgi:glycerol-3-phosphate acyltransferase PlsY
VRLALFALIGYVVGSVPFAFLVAWRRGGFDIRRLGSGNVGAANVQRVVGSRAALVTALLDVTKGAVPVLLARFAGVDAATCAMAGAGAVVGHVYPVWLRFRGGKGVSTTLGACLMWAPPVAGVAVAVFAVATWASRMVSVGSVAAAIVIGPLAYAWGAPRAIVLALFAAGWLIVFRHRGNLLRVAAGTERRIG